MSAMATTSAYRRDNSSFDKTEQSKHKHHSLPQGRQEENNKDPNRITPEKSEGRLGRLTRADSSPISRILPPSRAAHSLRAAFEATSSLSSNLARNGQPSSSQHARSHIPVKARANPRTSTIPARSNTNSMMDSAQGQGSPRGRQGDGNRARESSSSPPRGLREAYERIVDEEMLAAEESAIDDAGNDQDDASNEWSGPIRPAEEEPLDQRPLESEEVRRSASSSSLKRPHRSSAHSRLHGHRKAANSEDLGLEESTIDSGSISGSTLSGLSSLENGTDDSFVRTLAKHRRDQQRINGALKGDGPVFSRAQHADRGLMHDGLRQRDKLDEIMATEKQLAAESGHEVSDVSDLPVHVPRAWGRKSRQRPDWRDRDRRKRGDGSLLRSSTPERAEISKPEKKRINDRDESMVDWVAAAADTPLPSVEDEVAIEARTASQSRRQSKSTEGAAPPGLDDEFAPRSLQISTSPIIRAKLSALERIREREIDALKGRAVTTNRLGQIHEKTSKENLKPRQDVEQTNTAQEQAGLDGETRSHISVKDSSQRDQPTITRDDDETEAPSEHNEQLGAIPRSYERAQDSARQTQASATQPKDLRKERIADSGRDKQADTQDLLRQLARATSNSPSPSPTLEATRTALLQPAVNDSKPYVAVPVTVSLDKSAEIPQGSAAISRPSGADKGMRHEVADENPTPRVEKARRLDATPALTIGGWVDTPAVNGYGESFDGNTSKKGESASLSIRDLIRATDFSTLRRRTSRETNHKHDPTKDDDEDRNRRYRRARRASTIPPSGFRKRELTYPGETMDGGDSTIDSLDRLLADETLDFTATSLFGPHPPLGSNQAKDPIEDRDKTLDMISRKDRLEEQGLAYERMNQRVQSLLLSIRDAKQGIEMLESKVGGKLDRPYWACPDCGHFVAVGSGNGHEHPNLLHDGRHRRPSVFRWLPTWLGLHRLKLPALYHRRPEPDGKIRLTWLGLFALVSSLYVLAEYIT